MRFFLTLFLMLPLVACGTTNRGFEPDPSSLSLRQAIQDHVSRSIELHNTDQATLAAVLLIAQQHTVIGEFVQELLTIPELAHFAAYYEEAVGLALNDADISEYILNATVAAILANQISGDLE